MTRSLFIKIFLTWFLFIPIAIINGIVRNNVYGPVVGELLAHQISTVLAIILFFLLVFLMMRNELTILSMNKLLLVGLIWVIVTIIFEFIFGHYVAGHSWQKLFADYNLFEGRVWIFFLLSSGLTPVILKNFVK